MKMVYAGLWIDRAALKFVPGLGTKIKAALSFNNRALLCHTRLLLNDS